MSWRLIMAQRPDFRGGVRGCGGSRGDPLQGTATGDPPELRLLGAWASARRTSTPRDDRCRAGNPSPAARGGPAVEPLRRGFVWTDWTLRGRGAPRLARARACLLGEGVDRLPDAVECALQRLHLTLRYATRHVVLVILRRRQELVGERPPLLRDADADRPRILAGAPPRDQAPRLHRADETRQGRHLDVGERRQVAEPLIVMPEERDERAIHWQ